MAVIIGSSGHGKDIAATVAHDQIFGHHCDWDGTRPYYIGINDPQIRAKVAAELGGLGLTWIHPRALVSASCTIGSDVHVNYRASMTRTVVGDGTTIGPGVTIGGDVTIGQRVFVGMGALIGVAHPGETVTIGDDAVIGAGAVVLHDIPAGQTWVGNPARRIK